MINEMKDRIKVISGSCEFKFKEKGSLFVGLAEPVESEENANEFLKVCKKKYFDASHHTYCYNINSEIVKYSDAGEPNGTAGIRISNAINHYDLTNLILVVVRYFGGTKLGVGPLGKAYYHTAFETLKSAGIIEKQAFQKAIIQFEYDQLKTIHHLLKKNNVQIEKMEYTPNPTIHVLIKPDLLDTLKKDIANFLSNKFTFTISDVVVYI